MNDTRRSPILVILAVILGVLGAAAFGGAWLFSRTIPSLSDLEQVSGIFATVEKDCNVRIRSTPGRCVSILRLEGREASYILPYEQAAQRLEAASGCAEPSALQLWVRQEKRMGSDVATVWQAVRCGEEVVSMHDVGRAQEVFSAILLVAGLLLEGIAGVLLGKRMLRW